MERDIFMKLKPLGLVSLFHAKDVNLSYKGGDSVVEIFDKDYPEDYVDWSYSLADIADENSIEIDKDSFVLYGALPGKGFSILAPFIDGNYVPPGQLTIEQYEILFRRHHKCVAKSVVKEYNSNQFNLVEL